LRRAHHAGEGAAADRAQAIAEGRSATGGELQGRQCAIWTVAGIAVGGSSTAGAVEPDVIGLAAPTGIRHPDLAVAAQPCLIRAKRMRRARQRRWRSSGR